MKLHLQLFRLIGRVYRSVMRFATIYRVHARTNRCANKIVVSLRKRPKLRTFSTLHALNRARESRSLVGCFRPAEMVGFSMSSGFHLE